MASNLIQSVKIFLGCLPGDTKTEELSAYFKDYCTEIVKIKVKYRNNNICSGYGYFIARFRQEGLTTMLAMQHFYKQRSIECRVYLTGEDLKNYQIEFNKRRVYVGKLPDGLKDMELFNAFSRVTEVRRAYVANNPDKEGNSFGFVILGNEQDAGYLLEMGRIIIRGGEAVIKKVKFQRGAEFQQKGNVDGGAGGGHALQQPNKKRLAGSGVGGPKKQIILARKDLTGQRTIHSRIRRRTPLEVQAPEYQNGASRLSIPIRICKRGMKNHGNGRKLLPKINLMTTSLERAPEHHPENIRIRKGTLKF